MECAVDALLLFDCIPIALAFSTVVNLGTIVQKINDQTEMNLAWHVTIVLNFRFFRIWDSWMTSWEQ